jgi:DNA polymerase-1
VNIQNIPRKDKIVKAAFRPKLDALLCCDYDQVEMRLLAWYMWNMGDPSMVEAFLAGKDMHNEAGMAVLGKSEADMTDEDRQVGKTFNYSIIFGGGKPTIVKQLGVSYQEAGAKLRAYHGRWPGIQFLQNSLEQTMATRCMTPTCQRHGNGTDPCSGYITTIAGRHLSPADNHKLINSVCQGSAAELMRWAMVKADRYVGERLMASHLVNTVHDEVMLDCVFAEIPELTRVVPVLMDYPPISEVIPLSVAVEWTTTTWAEKALYEGELVA